MWPQSLFLAHWMQLYECWVSPSPPLFAQECKLPVLVQNTAPVFKTQCSCRRKGTLGVTVVWLSVVTIMCYLPFLMWIWGARCHLIRIISLQTVQTMMA